MKFLKGLGIAVLVIVVILVLVLGYFGFMPGVSNVFGSNQPEDLGVIYTEADYASAHARNGTTHTVLTGATSPENSIRFSSLHPVNTTYTQAEFTALINLRDWEYYPLQNCQLRINPDNSVEFSGIIITSRLKPYLQAMRVSESGMDQVTKYLKYIPVNAAVYASGKLEISNGQIINTDIGTVKIGNLDLTGQIEDNLGSIISGAYNQMQAFPGFSVKTLKFANGKVQFEGTLPDSARTVN